MPDQNRYARGLEIMEEVQGPEGAADILEGLGAMHPDLPRYVVELFEALLQVGLYAGVPRALNAIRVLREVEGEASLRLDRESQRRARTEG